MIYKKEKLISLTCILFFVVMTIIMAGCTNDEALPLETDLPDNGIEEEGLPAEPNVTGDNLEPKEYENYLEAYLDILTINRLVLTDEQLDDGLISCGIDVGDGKIAILDVYGDETPELLYLYVDTLFTKLKILTYSKDVGIISVFDSIVYTAAGGDNKNYCIYLTHDGELMDYHLVSIRTQSDRPFASNPTTHTH